MNPYTGTQVQRYSYQDQWGTQVYRSSGYSPVYGGFNQGYYQPGFGTRPYGGSFYDYRR